MSQSFIENLMIPFKFAVGGRLFLTKDSIIGDERLLLFCKKKKNAILQYFGNYILYDDVLHTCVQIKLWHFASCVYSYASTE